MSVTFQWEPFHRVSLELALLLRQHWQEVALDHESIPLAPDWDRYYQFALMGIFHVVTVRDSGRMVGYCTWMVCPHLHYSTALWAHNDVLWLSPAYREGFTGIRMMRFSLDGLRAMGVRVVHVTTMDHFEKERGGLGRIFEFLKFKRIQSVYSLDLGDPHGKQEPTAPT